MSNILYFLRHGKTKVDPNVPISQWVLAPVGEQQVQDLADSNVFKDIEVIITSTEQKAIDTAKPTAAKFGLEIQSIAELSELDRDKGGFIPAERYEQIAQEALTNRDTSVNKWESASHALARFSQAVESINKQYQDKNILIVGHGYTINLYFAQLLNQLDQVYERLNTNNFGDWGIVSNNQVIKDIAKL